ncbi:MAG: fumarylacetoacetate hydrolase family protein [Acidobacteria bacterium]|nr:fumarylacetoacetate hydrolase family protein [Acidobacteriota bacterium]
MRVPHTVTACVLALVLMGAAAGAQQKVTRYVRYADGGTVSFGILEGEMIRPLAGDLFSDPQPAATTVRLADVQLLAPCQPSKVIAVGLNYKSHLGERPSAEYPGLFAKLPSSIVGPDDFILLPTEAKNAHYEGEMVIVIGRRAKNLTPAEAPRYIFGVTAGNDVSERDWQRADLQWFRAKASDTFGPIGPVIARGLNYDDLLVQTRVNGEVRQSQRTKDLIFNTSAIVSYISKYVTLLPGDLIFTGTPGQTKALNPGDLVEVEVEGVGVLRNKVVRVHS